MKKFFIGLMVFSCLFSFVGCNTNAVEGTDGKELISENTQAAQSLVRQSVALYERDDASYLARQCVSIQSAEELQAFEKDYPEEQEFVTKFSTFNFASDMLVLYTFEHSSAVKEINLVQSTVEDSTLILLFEYKGTTILDGDYVLKLFVVSAPNNIVNYKLGANDITTTQQGCGVSATFKIQQYRSKEK